ncbi:hypothetical protein [Fredinandcohnia quinoae]|nr:hypothetical protein [Fredinandcohnia sp. SECRCQ15]
MKQLINWDFDTFVKEQKKHKPIYLGNNSQTKNASKKDVDKSKRE